MERVLSRKLGQPARRPLTADELKAVSGGAPWTAAHFCGDEYDRGNYD